MSKFDYDKLSVNELTVDTLNLLRDGNMIIKSNAAVRLNVNDTSLVLNKTSIHLDSDEIAINDTNLTQFLQQTFITDIKINNESVDIVDGTINIDVPTDYLTLDNDNLIIPGNIQSNNIDANDISGDNLSVNTLTIGDKITIDSTGISSNSNLDIEANSIISKEIYIKKNNQNYEVALKIDIPTVPNVDNVLDADSTNPVQNKIIKQELDKKYNTSDILQTFINNSTQAVSAKAVVEKLDEYMTISDFDSTFDDYKQEVQNTITDLQNQITVLQNQVNTLTSLTGDYIFNKQHLNIIDMILEDNTLYLYININLTSDVVVSESGLIFDNTNSLTNITEDKVIIENNTPIAIENNFINNKLIIVKNIDITDTDTYLYFRLYATITKDDTPATIYSPLYIITKDSLQSYNYYKQVTWNP